MNTNPAVHTLIEQIDSPVASFFSSCTHCGMCADACMFYTETQNPLYTPIRKLELMRKVWWQEYTFWGKVFKALGLSRAVNDEDLRRWEPLVYDSCTLCGRCSLVCPMGNDIVYMLRKMREAMAASGYVPSDLKHSVKNTLDKGSPMGVTPQTLKAQVVHIERETGRSIPQDQKGAQYLLLLSSAEVAQFPEFLSSVALIFQRAGVSWTLSSTCFEATNAALHMGSSDLAAQILQRIVAEAERLQVQTVISPECGHAYMALRWEGPNLLGRSFPFEVKHILEVLSQLQDEGKLLTHTRESGRLTFHDPCQLARRGGINQEPRKLLQQVAENFVEMEDHGTFNWCCGGGGGVGVNERAKTLRLVAFNRKRKQLEPMNVDRVVTACSNCRNMLEDGLEYYHMDNIQVTGLTEIIAAQIKRDDVTVTRGE
ncbi:MAG: (Fe-S)-binding protein [Gammaproteobacteria bacterium]|nr:(Fe-S)-binding protein [Gammaproteobacteria bacterium]MDH5800681.1 (Fe-S)-binding protein [Gammaproteobacteria bacterium]